MNSNNIVKIGTALKWRNTFDPNKRYYNENIVTMCGCIFRCKELLVQGKSPVQIIDKAGHIAYTNTNSWDVILDFASYYNSLIDYIERVDTAEAQIRENTKNIKANKDEIDKINTDNKVKFETINGALNSLQALFNQLNEQHIADMNAIDTYHTNHENEHMSLDISLGRILENIENIIAVNDKQQQQIDSFFGHVTTYSDGLWDNDLPWSNTLKWVNTPNENMIEHENRISHLEKQLSEAIRINTEQQKKIEILISIVSTEPLKQYNDADKSVHFKDYINVKNYEPLNDKMHFDDYVVAKNYDPSNETVTIAYIV